jgi:hypothetical protein
LDSPIYLTSFRCHQIILTISVCFLCIGMFSPYSNRKRDAGASNGHKTYANSQPGRWYALQTMVYVPGKKGKFSL